MMTNRTFKFDNSFLLAVISEAPYGVIVFDMNGIILLENELAINFIGKSSRSLIGTQIHSYFDIFELSELLTQILEGEREKFDVMEMVQNDKVLTIRCRKTEKWSILTVQDITRWKHVEMSEVQSVIEAQENERQRIALEIHDGIGPQMSSSIHQLETILDRIESEDPETAKNLQAIVDTSNEVSEELRNISHALMPRVLIDFGLVAALQGLTNRINAGNKCRVEFIHAFSGEPLEKAIELNLYRITQELLNNGTKHSSASSIFVQLVKNKNRLFLSVEDNGKGFNLGKINNSDGIGLSNIEMRTKVLGGELNIDSSPGRGTIITVEIQNYEH